MRLIGLLLRPWMLPVLAVVITLTLLFVGPLRLSAVGDRPSSCDWETGRCSGDVTQASFALDDAAPLADECLPVYVPGAAVACTTPRNRAAPVYGTKITGLHSFYSGTALAANDSVLLCVAYSREGDALTAANELNDCCVLWANDSAGIHTVSDLDCPTPMTGTPPFAIFTRLEAITDAGSSFHGGVTVTVK